MQSAAEAIARELRDWREEVRESFREVKATQSEGFREVKAKQDLTNGRVRKLELWQARWDGVRAGFSWLPAVALSVVSGALVAVLAHLLG
jgi:hypothetical protein